MGVSVMHRPGKVVVKVRQRNVYSVTSREKDTYASVFCECIWLCITTNDGFRGRSHFWRMCSSKYPLCQQWEWVDEHLLQWFQFFLSNIPPTRPVLLIMNRHSSHVSIEVIPLAWDDNIHLLCVPAHTTCILQLLDVGVFKSKACRTAHLGRVVVSDRLASLFAEAPSQHQKPFPTIGKQRLLQITPRQALSFLLKSSTRSSMKRATMWMIPTTLLG